MSSDMTDICQRGTEMGEKCPENLAGGLRLPRRKSATWAHGFTSVPKERVLRIFFARKNPTASAGFEPTILGIPDD